MPLFRKILCPIDFDTNSLRALGLAAELARESKTNLYLLHVVPIPTAADVAVPLLKMETAARTKLERIARERVEGGGGYEIDVTTGEPAVEILRAAKRIGVDLIVMATHGRRGLTHLLLGSVAEQTIREALCPVLTISPKVRRAGALRTTSGRKRRA
jgi:nucleotide-binding universal stress UspA family protein